MLNIACPREGGKAFLVFAAAADFTDEPWTPEVELIAGPRSKRLVSDKRADRKAAVALRLKAKIERPSARKSRFTDYELIEQAQRGDKNAAWELVHRYQDHIRAAAASRSIQGLDFDDKVQHATIGFLSGIKTFDPSLGYQLSTHTRWTIRAEFKKVAAEANPALKVHRRRGESDQDLERRRWFVWQAFNPPSLNEPVFDDGEPLGEVGDLTPDESIPDPIDVIDSARRDAALADALKTLTPRELSLFEARHLSDAENFRLDPLLVDTRGPTPERLSKLDEPFRHNGLGFSQRKQTLDALGKKHGISGERTRQLETEARRKIASALKRTQNRQPAQQAKPIRPELSGFTIPPHHLCESRGPA